MGPAGQRACLEGLEHGLVDDPAQGCMIADGNTDALPRRLIPLRMLTHLEMDCYWGPESFPGNRLGLS